MLCHVKQQNTGAPDHVLVCDHVRKLVAAVPQVENFVLKPVTDFFPVAEVLRESLKDFVPLNNSSSEVL